MSTVLITDLIDADQLAKTAAGDLALELGRLLDSQKSVNLVLTGGTVGTKVLSELAPLVSNLELERLFLWWGDERFVDPANSERNFIQAREALLSRIHIPEANIQAMPSTADGELLEASKAFGERLESKSPVFDIVLLGLGADGHVASLFPGSKPIEFGSWLVAELDSPKPPQQRISLSYEALSSAKQVWFLVAGADKAPAVSRVFDGDDLPATKVTGKELTKWYMDQAAASGITS